MKKIIITNKQFNLLKKSLISESNFDDFTNKSIKPNDILVITTNDNIKKFKITNNTNGQIIFENANYIYFMVYTSIDNDKLEVRRISKTKEKEKLNNISSWSTVTFDNVTKIELYRGNKLIDIVDGLRDSDSSGLKNDNPVNKETETDTIDNEPDNVGDESDNDLKTDEEELKDDGQELYKAILEDPFMQKAFYRQPSFWQLFKAELTGKEHPGKGIITVMDLVNKYLTKKRNYEIGDGFIGKGVIYLIPLKPIELKYGGNNILTINTLEPLKMNYLNKKYITDVILQKEIPGSNGYYLRINVLEKTDKTNIKKCKIEIGKLTSKNNFKPETKLDDINFKFLESDGYKTQND